MRRKKMINKYFAYNKVIKKEKKGKKKLKEKLIKQ